MATQCDQESTAQTLHSDIWLRLSWHNQFTGWQPQDFEGIRVIHVSAFDVWVPDVVVYNAISKSQSLDDLKKDVSVTVEWTGRMHWNYSLVVKTSCSLNMTYFPVDTQDCFVELSTWTYSGLEVHVQNGSDAIDLGTLTENGEYKLISTEVVPYEKRYVCCPEEPYYGIRYHLILKRLPAFYLLNIGLPTLLMLVLAFVAILLPAESESKLTLGVTIFLSQVVMVMVVTEYTPVQSLTTPFLTKYMLNLLMMMTVYILICVCVVRMRTHARASVHVPVCLRWVFLNPAMLCLFFPVRWHQHRKRLHREASNMKDVGDVTILPLGTADDVRLNKITRSSGLQDPGFEAGFTVLNNGVVSCYNERAHDVACQTELPSNLSFQHNVICHKNGTFDLLCLSEWVLLALIWERFWNTLLILSTLIWFLWNLLIVLCDPMSQCPEVVFNPWPW